MVSGLYAAIFVLLQVIFIMKVVKLRWAKEISLGDGGDEELNRRVRGHANFIETVPMALALMVIAELSGAPLWAVHALGTLMVLARISHYYGMTTGSGHGKFRFYGMVITITVLGLGAALCVWLALPVLLGF